MIGSKTFYNLFSTNKDEFTKKVSIKSSDTSIFMLITFCASIFTLISAPDLLGIYIDVDL